MSELSEDVVMRTPSKIEKEIALAERRREALAADVAAVQRELDEARQGLTSGKAPVERVTAVQSTYTALSEALAGLDARLTELRFDQLAAQAAAAREARIGLLLRHAREADDACRVIDATRIEVNEQLKRMAASINAAYVHWQTAQIRWLEEAKQIAEGVSEFSIMRRDRTRDLRELEAEADALVAELEGRGADLDAVLAEFGTRQRYLAITRHRPLVNVEPFGQLMPTILTVAASYQARQDADAGTGAQRGIQVSGRSLSRNAA